MEVNTSVSPSYNIVSTSPPGNMSANISAVVGVDEMSGVDIVTFVIQMILAIFIVGGNVLTILAVHRTPRLHTVPNSYVVSLAVADLLAGLALPFYAAIIIPGVDEFFDNHKYMCISRHAFLIISAGNSMLSMVQIAVDRLIYIAYPLSYNRIATPYRARIVIATSWFLSVIVGTMPFYYNIYVDSCELFDVLTMEYQVYIQFLIFCLSSLVSGGCYCYIFKISYHQRKALSDSLRRGKGDTETAEVKATFRREWPMIKMFVLVFWVFFACWCPAMVGIVVGSTVGISLTVMNILVSFCLLNSGMNFIIYGAKNRHFRCAYIRLLCGHRLDRQFNMAGMSGSGNGVLLN